MLSCGVRCSHLGGYVTLYITLFSGSWELFCRHSLQSLQSCGETFREDSVAFAWFSSVVGRLHLVLSHIKPDLPSSHPYILYAPSCISCSVCETTQDLTCSGTSRFRFQRVVHFSSRWRRSALESPYLFHYVSQQSTQLDIHHLREKRRPLPLSTPLSINITPPHHTSLTQRRAKQSM